MYKNLPVPSFCLPPADITEQMWYKNKMKIKTKITVAPTFLLNVMFATGPAHLRTNSK